MTWNCNDVWGRCMRRDHGGQPCGDRCSLGEFAEKNKTGIKVRRGYPDYEKRVTVRCVTLTITMITGGGTGRTRLTARLDEGLPSEREIEWEHAADHPVFVFREQT